MGTLNRNEVLDSAYIIAEHIMQYCDELYEDELEEGVAKTYKILGSLAFSICTLLNSTRQ